MKKLLIIPAVLLTVGGFFLTSCGNADTNTTMKAPVQNGTDSSKEDEENENKNKATVTATNEKDAKSKTIDNMQAAFKGETNASAKYAAYSKKAEQEGFHAIALLFKAASTSENIHANNHKAVLQESGIAVPLIQPVFTVKTTKENLQDAIAGETYEAATMYPEFLKMANEADNQVALISLNYAYKTEKRHRVFYEAALAAISNNTVNTLATVLYVCPTCGNTYAATAPARCGVSMTSSEKFIKISSL